MDVVAVQQASGADPSANREMVRRSVEGPAGAADLVVFPEATQMAFGDRPHPLASQPEALDGPFVSLLLSLSRGGPAIMASMFERSDAPTRPFNTTVVACNGDLVGVYRKIHLYDALGFVESEGVSPGMTQPDNVVVVNVGGARIGIQTCFDVRFPEMSATLVDRGAQVLVLGAAWVPGPHKVDQWHTLLAARAIETSSFVVAAAQPAPRYCGHSVIIAPSGEVLHRAGPSPTSISADLDLSSVERTRSAMPVTTSRRLGRS